VLAALKESRTDLATLACIEDRLSTAMINMGKLSEASALLLRAAQRLLAAPPNEPAVLVMNHLARLYLEVRDLDAAEHWAREALRIAQTVYPPHHPRELSAWNTIATVHACRREYARAEPIYRSVLYHFEQAQGSHPVDVGLAAVNLAEVSWAQGRPMDSAGLYQKAIAAAAFASAPEAASRQVLLAQAGLMLAYARSGRARQAEALLVETLAAAQEKLEANDPDLAVVLHHASLVRMEQGDHAAARLLCERALTVIEASYGVGAPNLLEPLETYAWILRSAKDKRAAKRVEVRLRELRLARTP
jgi:tetratricopeptide (TPR) repeat protein